MVMQELCSATIVKTELFREFCLFGYNIDNPPLRANAPPQICLSEAYMNISYESYRLIFRFSSFQ